MDDFAQELVDRISDFLAYDDLKNTLLVSRKFQYAAERASGEFALYVFRKSTAEEGRAFLSRFGRDGRRFRYLRNIHVRTSVPPLLDTSNPNENPGPCWESLEELQQKDEMFSVQISRVWHLLDLVGRAADGAGQIQMRIFTPSQSVSPDFCDHRRYSAWRVHLLSPNLLPELPFVQALTICNQALNYSEYPNPQCKLDLRVIVDLACTLPNLEYLGCKIGVDEWTDSHDHVREHLMRDYVGCRRDTRLGFADAFHSSHLPASLREVQLDFINQVDVSVLEQEKRMFSLIDSTPHDPFSSSLRILSYSLRKMQLHAVADRTLFWPGDEGAAPFWPNLELLTVLFHICSPDGGWYFDAPLEDYEDGYEEEEDDEDEDEDENDFTDQPAWNDGYPPFLDDPREKKAWCFRFGPDTPLHVYTFRVVPIDERLVPFLSAFARAAAEMPKLQEAWLWAPLSFNPEGIQDGADEEMDEKYSGGDCGWGVVYDAPEVSKSEGVALEKTRWITWRVGAWRPNTDLHHAFQSIGEKYHGESLKETWQEADEGDALPPRTWFADGKFDLLHVATHILTLSIRTSRYHMS